jgi:hypothetical protein
MAGILPALRFQTVELSKKLPYQPVFVLVRPRQICLNALNVDLDFILCHGLLYSFRGNAVSTL